jgi:hypothetical protein
MMGRTKLLQELSFMWDDYLGTEGEENNERKVEPDLRGYCETLRRVFGNGFSRHQCLETCKQRFGTSGQESH